MLDISRVDRNGHGLMLDTQLQLTSRGSASLLRAWLHCNRIRVRKCEHGARVVPILAGFVYNACATRD